MKPRPGKRVPKLKTDKAAEAFLKQDLAALDFSQFKPVRFEFEKKDEQINMRVPRPLLTALKARAKARGNTLHTPHTRGTGTGLGRARTLSVAYGLVRKAKGFCIRLRMPASSSTSYLSG
jgi:predicted DNA binding CopG/RHH family protein